MKSTTTPAQRTRAFATAGGYENRWKKGAMKARPAWQRPTLPSRLWVGPRKREEPCLFERAMTARGCEMRLTEIRINLCGGPSSRLKAFCSLTFDNTFVIRDVKLIDGNDDSGGTKLFLAMPSRKLTDHCRRCGEKNHLKARFCNGCGGRLDENRSLNQPGMHGGNGHGRVKL